MNQPQKQGNGKDDSESRLLGGSDRLAVTAGG